MRAKVRERQSVLFSCPFFLGKGLPLAVLFLTNQRRPAFRLWIEPELVCQRAFLGIEPKFDAYQVWIKPSTTDARVAAPENIYPMTHVAFRGVIQSDKHECFVFRRLIAGAVMKFHELVFQHRLAADSTFNRASVAHFARNTPVADEIIEKRILKRLRRTSSKQDSDAEQKQDHWRSRCGKHGKLDSQMVFHFRSAINAFRSRKPFFDFD